MIKVCHLTSVHKSQDPRIMKKQCASLARAGYDTYLVAGGESYEEHDVKVVGVGEFSGGRLNRMTKKAKAVYKKALELDCDIYQIHDPELLPYALKLKRKRKTVIYDAHEDIVSQIDEKEYLNDLSKYILAFAIKQLLIYVTNRVDTVIYVTPHYKDCFKNSEKIMLTNYPIVRKDTLGIENRLHNQLVFTGGVRNIWCLHKIIKAVQNLDVKFKVCGSAEENYLSVLKKVDVNNKFEYLGIIKHEEAFKLQQCSSIGMSVLKYHKNVGGKTGTLGNTKIFEYMIAGLPIVCTDFVLWKEIVDKYDCGICVDPEDIDEISNAIKFLLDNPERAKQMGENGRRAVEQEFNWGTQEVKLLKLYKELSDEIRADRLRKNSNQPHKGMS